MRFKSLKLGFCLLLPMMAVPVVASADHTDSSINEITKRQTTLFPQNFEVSYPDASFRFSKNSRSDSFQTLKSEEKLIGFSQDYSNSACLARITYFYPNLGRLSNTKLKRYLKEQTPFQITHQDSDQTAGNRYHYTVSAHPDQIDVFLVEQFDNNILQIRLACQTLPALTQKENKRLSVDWAKFIAEKLSTVLKGQ